MNTYYNLSETVTIWPHPFLLFFVEENILIYSRKKILISLGQKNVSRSSVQVY